MTQMVLIEKSFPNNAEYLRQILSIEAQHKTMRSWGPWKRNEHENQLWEII